MPKKLLLNADLGEMEAPQVTEQLLAHLDLANIACGVHAGSPERLSEVGRQAQQKGVQIGAHPGAPSTPEAMGRDAVDLTPKEFRMLLESQLETYLARSLPLQHLKLHGYLYHLSENHQAIRCELLASVREHGCQLVCLAGGHVHRLAAEQGLPVLPEAFLDRAYLSTGQLVPRTRSNALITSSSEVISRIDQLVHHQQIIAVDGKSLKVQPRTLCIHADSPSSLEIASIARRHLDKLSSEPIT